MTRIALLSITTALVTLAPGTALAQSDALDPILACRAIADDGERLACFDQAAAALSGDEAAGEIVVVRREQIEQAERESFGFSLPGVSGLAQSVGGLFARDPSREPRAPEPHHAAQAPVQTAQAEPAPAAPTPSGSPEPASPPAPAADAAQASRTQPAAGPDPVEAATGVRVIERNSDGEAIVVTMAIERAHQFDYQRFRFYMENGQVWEQLETISMRMPRNGEAIAHIRRLPMGGYVMRINDRGRASDVRRIR
jgi:hypothetical protein